MGQQGVLVASGLGAASGGGLYGAGADGVEALDGMSTTGFAVAPDGRRLARLLWTSDDVEAPARLVTSDARGRRSGRAIRALREAHGLLWLGDDELVAVSTLTNAILWIDARGRVRR